MVRLDLERLRQGLPGPWEQGLDSKWGESFDPSGILAASLSRTKKLWAGFRPSPNLMHWDYVLVLEGEFGAISEEQLLRAFRPPRTLGGGYVAYDAWKEPHRLSPARLYAYRDSRMIFASSAEVDALGRVIESGRYERVGEPPERGLLAFRAPAGRLARQWADSSPKLARLLDSAGDMTGSVDLTARGLTLDARLSFDDSERAGRAARALELVGRALAEATGAGPSPEGGGAGQSSSQADGRSQVERSARWTLHAESSDTDVVLSATFPLETLADWFAMR